MEPTTATIVAAVVAGAVAATQEVAGKVIVDAYNGLKSLIASRFGKQSDLAEALDKVEGDPESQGRRMVLEEELARAGVDRDAEVVARARELLELAREKGLETGLSYRVELHGSGAIAQGPGAVAAGEGGVAVGGDLEGGIHIGGKEADKR